jgi:copper chaperone CopZ
MKIKKIAGVQNVDIKEDGQAVVEADREIGMNELSEAVAAAGHTIEKI